jgi:hypothetical protein
MYKLGCAIGVDDRQRILIIVSLLLYAANSKFNIIPRFVSFCCYFQSTTNLVDSLSGLGLAVIMSQLMHSIRAVGENQRVMLVSEILRNPFRRFTVSLDNKEFTSSRKWSIVGSDGVKGQSKVLSFVAVQLNVIESDWKPVCSCLAEYRQSLVKRLQELTMQWKELEWQGDTPEQVATKSSFCLLCGKKVRGDGSPLSPSVQQQLRSEVPALSGREGWFCHNSCVASQCKCRFVAPC